MKNKTIKKNNNPRHITIKHNKNPKKKTNKKGKSNILKKTKKINRKNHKLLIGGNYNENFFSVELDDNSKNPIDTSLFSYKFMKKYIENLNPETDIPNENVYKTYRNYYQKKDISKKKIQDLREIRLNYYLKTVVSIMKKEDNLFKHSEINFENKPIDLYTEINDIKTNYDTNVDILNKTDSKSSYFINCHGHYSTNSKSMLNLFTVPDNVIIHFLTPLNYLSYQYYDDDGTIEKQSIIDAVKSVETTKNDITSLLKINCFQNMITFLPGQKCFDINLSIYTNETHAKDRMGIYKISKVKNKVNEVTRDYGDYLIPLSNLIYNGKNKINNSEPPKLEFADDIITNIYISCCRSCNNWINNNLTIETMYIYENFIKQLNNSILDINKPDEILFKCINAYTAKQSLITDRNSEEGLNTKLTPKYKKTNSPRINEIINYVKSRNFSDLLKIEINKSEFTIKEIENLLYYILGNKKFEIIDVIHESINYEKNYNKYFLEKIFFYGLNQISSPDVNVTGLLQHLIDKYDKDKLKLNVRNNEDFNKIKLYLTGSISIAVKIKDIFRSIQNLENKKAFSWTILMTLINTDKINMDIVSTLFYDDDIIKHVDINFIDKFRNTLLNDSILLKNEEMVKLIFENEEKFGDSPIKLDIEVYEDSSLNNSVQMGNIEITKLLLAHRNINVNFNKNEDENTALHNAVIGNKIEIVKLLLDHSNINVNIKNKDGKTPLELTKNPEIIKLITNHKSSSQ
jgi:hypothetical protein